MPHFFISSKNVQNDFVILDDKETLKHLVGSLRVKVGEKLKFIDENEIQYFTIVENTSKKELKAKIEECSPSKRKLNFELHLVMSVLKQEAQSLAISNATQCGVSEIFPVLTRNCVPKKDKVEKWQKIAFEAAKQCERANLPKINEISTLEKVLKNYENKNVIVYAEKYADLQIRDAVNLVDKTKPIAVVIGPEGGFSEEEFQYFIDSEFKLVTLGDLIFKAPNAVTSGISNIVTRL